MDLENINKLKELLELKAQYEKFITNKGYISLWCYSVVYGGYSILVKDDEFLSIVKNIAKKRLNDINKQIEEF